MGCLMSKTKLPLPVQVSNQSENEVQQQQTGDKKHEVQEISHPKDNAFAGRLTSDVSHLPNQKIEGKQFPFSVLSSLENKEHQKIPGDRKHEIQESSRPKHIENAGRPTKGASYLSDQKVEEKQLMISGAMSRENGMEIKSCEDTRHHEESKGRGEKRNEPVTVIINEKIIFKVQNDTSTHGIPSGKMMNAQTGINNGEHDKSLIQTDKGKLIETSDHQDDYTVAAAVSSFKERSEQRTNYPVQSNKNITVSSNKATGEKTSGEKFIQSRKDSVFSSLRKSSSQIGMFDVLLNALSNSLIKEEVEQLVNICNDKIARKEQRSTIKKSGNAYDLFLLFKELELIEEYKVDFLIDLFPLIGREDLVSFVDEYRNSPDLQTQLTRDEVDAQSGKDDGIFDERAGEYKSVTFDGGGEQGRYCKSIQPMPQECHCGPNSSNGACQRPEISGHTPQNHQAFPEASRWETSHMTLMRMEGYPLNFDQRHLTEEEIIRRWMMENVGDDDCLPSYPATRKTAKSINKANVTRQKYREILSNHIKEHLEKYSPFVKVVEKLAKKRYWYIDPSKNLVQAATAEELLNEAKCDNQYFRSALLKWIKMFDSSSRNKVPETSLGHLLAELAEAAKYETNCPVIIQIREDTRRKIVVCGNVINVESDVEAQIPDGGGAFQVVISARVNNYPTPDIVRALPSIACETLALAKDSPFENGHYKTVHQVSIFIVKSEEADKLKLHAYLIKCHVAVDTLERMIPCPMETFLVPSYLMHMKREFKSLRDPGFISFIFKAIKAVMLAFQGVEISQLNE